MLYKKSKGLAGEWSRQLLSHGIDETAFTDELFTRLRFEHEQEVSIKNTPPKKTPPGISVMASAIIGTLLNLVWRRKYPKVKIGWPSKGGPPIDHNWPLIDHEVTLINELGERSYLSEPYSVCSEDILKLAELIKQGWSCSISGMSGHYPGWTVAILLNKER